MSTAQQKQQTPGRGCFKPAPRQANTQKSTNAASTPDRTSTSQHAHLMMILMMQHVIIQGNLEAVAALAAHQFPDTAHNSRKVLRL